MFWRILPSACILFCLYLSGFCAGIEPDSIYAHVKILGSDSLEGRATGTRGAFKASEYIAGKLGQLGVSALPDAPNYFQDIPMHGSRTRTSSILTIQSERDTIFLQLDKDYLMYKTGAETFMPRSFPLVFVGYGIVAPEYDYNDYQTVEVEDKVVVYLDGEPRSENDQYFEGRTPTLYSSPEVKQRIAISRGARGSILIPRLRAASWERLVREFSFEDVRLAYSVSSHLSIMINPARLSLLMKNVVSVLFILLLVSFAMTNIV